MRPADCDAGRRLRTDRDAAVAMASACRAAIAIRMPTHPAASRARCATQALGMIDDLEQRAERVAARLLDRGAWISADLRCLPETAADMIGVGERTLANWRASLHPLPFVGGPRVTYRLTDLLAFIDANVSRAA